MRLVPVAQLAAHELRPLAGLVGQRVFDEAEDEVGGGDGVAQRFRAHLDRGAAEQPGQARRRVGVGLQLLAPLAVGPVAGVEGVERVTRRVANPGREASHVRGDVRLVVVGQRHGRLLSAGHADELAQQRRLADAALAEDIEDVEAPRVVARQRQLLAEGVEFRAAADEGLLPPAADGVLHGGGWGVRACWQPREK